MTTLPANISNLVGNLEVAQQHAPKASGGDFQYLKMTKAGEWLYGADETEVDSDSVFIVDPSSYAQGFVSWYDGELIDEQMAVAGQPPIIPKDLPELPEKPRTKDDPNGCVWSAQTALALKGIEGPDEGVQLLYKVSSRGGKQAIAELLAAIIERGRAGETELCPVVQLKTSSYKHKKYGKIYTPILDVEDWMDIPEPDDEPEPVAIDEPAAEPELEPEPEPEPEPKRKRRSRRAAS